MDTPGFVHRLVSWTGTALYVASTFALISLCWSVGDIDYDRQVLTDRDLGVGSGGSSVDDNVSGPSVDSESLFQSSQKIVHGKRWIAIYIKDNYKFRSGRIGDRVRDRVRVRVRDS